jgi:hypothetical protein
VAHPSAFPPEALTPEAMIALAQAILPNDIPPVVLLEITTEDFTDAGGLAGMTERLFTTPSAIARVWRAPAGRRQMIVSAFATRDPNGRPLRFEWRLLRGDPDRVRIEPMDDGATAARLTVDWHDPMPAPGGGPLTDRVDIGIFADNGVHLSAPAFVSILCPGHVARRHAPGPDGAPQLVEIDHDALGRGQAFDPVLHWSAPWRDSFRYGPDGELEGWTRTATGQGGLFADDPARVAEFGADGRLADGRTVIYEPQGTPPILSARLAP